MNTVNIQPKSVQLLNTLCGLTRAYSGKPLSDGMIAEKLDVSHTTMSQWINGVRPPRQIEALIVLLKGLPRQDVIRALDAILETTEKENNL